ncbi:MAG: tRNA lysidine(34) synthetase TilS [Cyclobacteriaceae bacterium]
MLDRFTHVLKRDKLCERQQRLLLAVSGGLDSMVMLDLFHRAGYEIGAAHCNFQLRSEESDADEVFVLERCKAIGIECYTARFHTKNYAAKNGVSTQMAARQLRYEWFGELLNSSWDLLATAHHADDNLETTLLHLVRGTGLSGVMGIPTKVDKIIRPLLSFSRKELEGYAQVHGLKWREDRSNTTTDYDRNYIRHELIPKLKVLNPALEQTFMKTNERLRAGGELFQMGLDGVKEKFLKEKSDQVFIDSAFAKLFHKPAGVLWELVKQYGFNYDQCENIIECIDKSPGSKFLTHSHQLFVDRAHLIIEAFREAQTEILIQLGDRRASLGTATLELEEVQPQSISQVRQVASLDAEKLKFPLVWRAWQEGDFFYPLGMSGKKKLSDFFIDNKMSLADKGRITVLVSGEDIVWVVGHRVDNRYKVVEHTRRQIRLVYKSDI